MGALREYQAQAARFALDNLAHHGGAGLFLDMGLGKTLTSIAVMDILHAADPTLRFLVVAPSLVARNSWPDELDHWQNHHSLDWAVACGTPKQRQAALGKKATVTVINQENIVWLDQTMKEWPWKALIVDELSAYKNPGAKRFRALKRRRANMDWCLGLTGTPATKNLLDLWAEMYLIDQGATLGGTLTKYRNRFFHPSRWMAGRVIEWAPNPGAQDEILSLIDNECLSMRAKDKLPGLPRLLTVDHWLDMPADTKTKYDMIRRDMVAELDDGRVVSAANAGVLTGKLSQLAAGCLYPDTDDMTGQVTRFDNAKLDRLDEIIQNADGPVLVFYRFQDELERMRNRYPDLREVHEKNVLDEWNRGRIPLLAAHPAAAKYGLNIQHGGHEIVWTSLTWSLDEYDQANARLHRSGQDRPVTVHRLLESGTVDRRIVDVLAGRARLHDAVMGALKNT